MVLKSSFQKILTRMQSTLSESLGIYPGQIIICRTISCASIFRTITRCRLLTSTLCLLNLQVVQWKVGQFASSSGDLVEVGSAFIDHVDVPFGGSSIRKTSLRRVRKDKSKITISSTEPASQSDTAVASDTLSGRLFGVSDLFQRPMVSISKQQYIVTGRSAGSITILPQQDVMSRLKKFSTGRQTGRQEFPLKLENWQSCLGCFSSSNLFRNKEHIPASMSAEMHLHHGGTKCCVQIFSRLVVKNLFIGKRLLLFYFSLKLHHSSPKALTDRHE
ncbi:hypothetical protein T01_14979 [Trichinella spiralis]|uniref:Uncharacterized protein n=1 Tax=Trichinella spiralis TaxID=6334 RepID=A0A0V1BK79_TRISP|nr:hypothetical protein T01_14979 [Trichinella spiralis]